MAFEIGKLSLFGFDLSRSWESFVQGWSDALRWPALAWLNPQEAVQLSLPDGTVEWRLGLSATRSAAGNAASPRAALLPDDLVLVRELKFPDLLQRDLDQALTLQVEALSPFAVEDLVWGWRSQSHESGGLATALALASRRQIDGWLASRGVAADAEVWVDGSQPICLQGYGDGKREKRLRRRRIGILLALALLVILLLLFAMTPFLVQRAQVFDAQDQQAALQAQVAPVVAAREALVRSTAQLAAIRPYVEGQLDLPALLERLTHLLPDDAHLIRMEVNGRQVRLAGFARNAAGLVESLGAQPDFAEVRTPTAISRSPDGRESFTVDFIVRNDEVMQ